MISGIVLGGNMKMELEREGYIQCCHIVRAYRMSSNEGRHRNTLELVAAYSKKVNCCNGVIKNCVLQ
jgi:hypothetical protein